MLPQTRGGYGRLQDFGIRFGYERVVLHLQPQVEAGRLEANTARTLLLLDHEPLPWSRWGEEFAAAMPDEIRELQERAASADGVPRREAIRNRVSSIMPLYRLSRYRPHDAAGGSATTTADAATGRRPARPNRTAAPPRGRQPTAASAPRGRPNRTSSPRAAQRRLGWRGQLPSRSSDLPDVAWISARDGTRAAGDLEDQAARYHPARHELTINADFRAITDLIAHWRRRYQGVPGARAVIEAQVREWCEQVLVEVVLAARNTSWNKVQLDALLSPTSLSAALLPRHLLHAMLQKRLAQKLGTARAEPSRSAWDARALRGHATARSGGTRDEDQRSEETAP